MANERTQSACQHCGAPAEEMTGGQQVYIECSNLTGYTAKDGTEVPPCGMRTPQVSASLDYSAWDRVTAIWNRSENDQARSRSSPLAAPQAVYYVGLYYVDDGITYLCFREYDSSGGHRPSELVNTYFVAVEGVAT